MCRKSYKKKIGKLETAQQVPLEKVFLSLPGEEGTHEVHYTFVTEDEAELIVDGQEVSMSYDWDLHEPLFEAFFGEDRNVSLQQMSRITSGYRVSHVGSEVDVQVWSEKTNELRKHIPPKVVKDLSKFMISPMPGTVISVDVKVGDKVFGGQGVAVLEAMKMQNVLRAAKDTVVKSISVKQGDEVAVDQVLIEFEN